MCVCVSEELCQRSGLHNLVDSSEMSASRASLSILDDDSTCSDNNIEPRRHGDDDDDVTGQRVSLLSLSRS